MAPYSVETQLFPKEPFEEAIAYFGEEGLGLELVEQRACHVYFEGDGGYVSVTVDIGEEKTTVELETQGRPSQAVYARTSRVRGTGHQLTAPDWGRR